MTEYRVLLSEFIELSDFGTDLAIKRKLWNFYRCFLSRSSMGQPG